MFNVPYLLYIVRCLELHKEERRLRNVFLKNKQSPVQMSGVSWERYSCSYVGQVIVPLW